ncbi:MAG: NAD(P)H-hydrate dehydratase [Mycobacteriaceae bacterium]
MREAHDVAAVREAEAVILARTAEGALMRRAAFGLAGVIVAELSRRYGSTSGRHVVLLVGAGGNGGDALWAGSFLRRRGVAVTAILLSPDRAHPGGLAALRRAGGRVGGSAALAEADLVVDGIVGLSARGGLRPDAAALVSAVRAPIVSVDLPSGVDPDTGVATETAVRATITVAFGACKPVHLLSPAHCGRVELVPLGLPLGESTLCAMEAPDVGARWPIPGPSDDKYTQGVVGVAAGSAQYPGAAVLCTGAAVASTSGMVRYAGTGTDAVLARWPEVVAVDNIADAGRVQAWVIGPGLGTGDACVAALEHALATEVPVLIDADAITTLAQQPDLLDGRRGPLLLTPHAGEFARLTGQEPGSDRVTAVRAAAHRFDATVLLKGHTTVIANPTGAVQVNTAVGAWAATAGSGDVLSGMLGALLATGLDPLLAAAVGAHVHALAAELAAAGAPTSASRLIEHLPQAIRDVRAARP